VIICCRPYSYRHVETPYKIISFLLIICFHSDCIIHLEVGRNSYDIMYLFYSLKHWWHTVFNIRYMITLIVSLYRNWYLHSTINKLYLLEWISCCLRFCRLSPCLHWWWVVPFQNWTSCIQRALYRNWYLHSTINKLYLLEYTGNQ
jgi:hypothetical protein